MKNLRRSGRVQSLLAIVALAASVVATPMATSATPRLTPKKQPQNPSVSAPQLERTESLGNVKLTPVTAVSKTAAPRGELPPIELNVDAPDPENATLSVFTFGTGTVQKLAFGNRFTLTNDQTPFQLEVVAAFLGELQDGTGLSVGETIGITVFADPGSTGQIANATVVFNGTAELTANNAIIPFQLPDPIVVKQGDIYIIFSDQTTDAEDTPVPVVQPDMGGSNDPRAFLSNSQNTPVDPTNTGGYFRGDAVQLPGNTVVRGFGRNAEAGALITGPVPPVDNTLSPITLPSASGTSDVVISFTAPAMPTFAEVEPNNSAAAAQEVPFGTVIQAVAKASDPGTDVGAGPFEDWFSFTLASAGQVTIDLVEDGGKDFDLYLYPKAGPFVTPIAASFGVCGAHELIPNQQLAAGQYVIGVDAFSPNPDCEASANTPYELIVTGPGGVRLTGYNVYCGASENFVADATSYIGTFGPGSTGVTVRESAVGAFYKVSAVYGDSQSEASIAVTGQPCEGGPTVSNVKVKRNGAGKVSFTVTGGSTAGLTISIGGVGFTKAPKVKGNGKVNQKGPLANGQTVGAACPSGCTITVMTSDGCTSITAP